MKKNSATTTDKTKELLEKLLVMQMHSMGATQNQIARTVGRAKAWVNGLVRDIPRRAESN